MNRLKVEINLTCAYCKITETISVYTNVLHHIKYNPSHLECKRLGNVNTMRKIRGINKTTKPSKCNVCVFDKPCVLCTFTSKDKLDTVIPEQVMVAHKVSTRRSTKYDREEMVVE